MMLYGGVEAGGTKFVCAVGTGPERLEGLEIIPTTTPEETIGRVIAFFNRFQPQISAIGVGSFGPIGLNPASSNFGKILNTPKIGWAQTHLIAKMGQPLRVPIVFDTDVNVAALGEATWGASQGTLSSVYLTIGTGIGGGVIVNGRPLHGLLHPEIGHMRLPHDSQHDQFSGICSYHGDCFEGLASGPAVNARWGIPGESIPPNHEAWKLEAHYIALGLANIICTLSPERIILGGGVMKQTILFQIIRRDLQQLLNEYISVKELTDTVDEYVVPPKLSYSGALGAIALASMASGSIV
jgi:fructokinase